MNKGFTSNTATCELSRNTRDFYLSTALFDAFRSSRLLTIFQLLRYQDLYNMSQFFVHNPAVRPVIPISILEQITQYHFEFWDLLPCNMGYYDIVYMLKSFQQQKLLGGDKQKSLSVKCSTAR